MINVTTITDGIILKEQDRFFAYEQFPDSYSIISETQTYIEFIDGVLVFDCTNVSINNVMYATILEFITAIGL
jgi:hypothetical protein